MCEDPPSVTWVEHPTERYDSRDRSLWLFAAHISPTMACLMLSRHPSLCSLHLSAHLRFAAYISRHLRLMAVLVEYASCAHRETTLCVSRESSVHHCLSLKAVLSSRLRDSTTAWSAEAFNTTGVVAVRGKASCVPSLFLSPALLRGRPHTCNRILMYGLLLNVERPPCLACDVSTSAECCETSLSLSCGKPTSAECFEASLPHLPWSSRAPSTSEPSRSLTSSMSFARGANHHVLDLAVLHPTAAQLGLWGSTVDAYDNVLPGPPG